MCWHRWSKWEEAHEDVIFRTRYKRDDKGNLEESNKEEVGYRYLQKRTCEKCNFVQVNVQLLNVS